MAKRKMEIREKKKNKMTGSKLLDPKQAPVQKIGDFGGNLSGCEIEDEPAEQFEPV